MSDPFPLPTDTRAVNIESRQYSLFNVDLGEGLPRVALKIGLFFFVPWFALMFLLGMPLLGPGMIAWFLPPALLLVRALQRDDGGRLRLASWQDRAAWLLSKHPAVVNADTATPAPLAPITVDLAFAHVDLPAPKEQPRGEDLPA